VAPDSSDSEQTKKETQRLIPQGVASQSGREDLNLRPPAPEAGDAKVSAGNDVSYAQSGALFPQIAQRARTQSVLLVGSVWPRSPNTDSPARYASDGTPRYGKLTSPAAKNARRRTITGRRDLWVAACESTVPTRGAERRSAPSPGSVALPWRRASPIRMSFVHTGERSVVERRNHGRRPDSAGSATSGSQVSCRALVVRRQGADLTPSSRPRAPGAPDRRNPREGGAGSVPPARRRSDEPRHDLQALPGRGLLPGGAP